MAPDTSIWPLTRKFDLTATFFKTRFFANLCPTFRSPIWEMGQILFRRAWMADSACPTVRFFFSTQKSNRASDETAERQRGRQGRASIPGFEFKNARTVGHAKSPPDHFLVKVCWQIFTFRRATLGTNFDDTRTQGAETTNVASPVSVRDTRW